MPVEVRTFVPFSGGSDLQSSVHTIPDTHARLIVDGMLDVEGLLYRRGPVRQFFLAESDELPLGIAAVENPITGALRYAVLTISTTDVHINVFDSAGAAVGNFIWDAANVAFIDDAPRTLFWGYPAHDRGMYIGLASSYSRGASALLGLWYGAALADFTNAATLARTNGSTTVTASAAIVLSSNMEPGMFLRTRSEGNDFIFEGVLKSISSTTVFLLEEGATATATDNNSNLTSILPVAPWAAQGAITSTTSSTSVVGAKTKFGDIKMIENSSGARLLRARDKARIGFSTAIPVNNNSLVLGANALLALTNERYYLVPTQEPATRHKYISLTNRIDDGSSLVESTALGALGWIVGVYQSRTWFANNPSSNGLRSDRHWFSEPELSYVIDTVAGYIDVGEVGRNESTVAICGSESCLISLKQASVWGVFGNAPSNFNVRKLGDDGCLSGGSVRSWRGNVIWAGRNGIHAWDGNRIVNLTADVWGTNWNKMITGFNAETDRMYSGIVRNHYVLHITNVSNPFTIRKGAGTSTPTKITLMLNLETSALTFITNMAFYGAIEVPSSFGKACVAIVQTDGGASSVVDFEDFFNDTLGNDTLLTVGGVLGPDLYIESKRYDIGDPQRKKLWKQLMLGKEVLTGDSLRLDTIVGLAETGTTSASQFTTTADFANQRIKFLKRNQYLGFRIYQDSADVTRIRLAPYALGFKLQRVGRV